MQDKYGRRTVRKEKMVGEGIWGWFAAVSGVMILVSALAIPFFVARIPADYFTGHGVALGFLERYRVLRMFCLVLKNVAGIVFILAGLAMLVLPGQGTITIFIGLMLTDFPGKRALLLRIIRRPAVLRTLNWIRARAHRCPLEAPGRPQGESDG